jgi:hypothetical protein
VPPSSHARRQSSPYWGQDGDLKNPQEEALLATGISRAPPAALGHCCRKARGRPGSTRLASRCCAVPACSCFLVTRHITGHYRRERPPAALPGPKARGPPWKRPIARVKQTGPLRGQTYFIRRRICLLRLLMPQLFASWGCITFWRPPPRARRGVAPTGPPRRHSPPPYARWFVLTCFGRGLCAGPGPRPSVEPDST